MSNFSCGNNSKYLALHMNGHGIRELEGVEECVGDHGGPGVRPGNLHKLGDHLGPQDTAMLVRQLDRTRVLRLSRAGLHSHVKFT